MCCEDLALDLPILALHVPAINLIPTVAAVVVTVAPPTGVQTLPVRTSVTNRGSQVDQRKTGNSLKQVLSIVAVPKGAAVVLFFIIPTRLPVIVDDDFLFPHL